MDLQLLAFAEAAIRQHLAARPHGADSLRGIHDWWIGWEAGTHISYTECALHRLEADGLLERLAMGTGELWRLRRAETGGDASRVDSCPPSQK
ncbi:MAG: hypothetical protein V4454_19770 [Pseudomonadota bacterium]